VLVSVLVQIMNLVFVIDQDLVYLQLDPLRVGPQYQAW
jgi:hypothetical protein